MMMAMPFPLSTIMFCLQACGVWANAHMSCSGNLIYDQYGPGLNCIMSCKHPKPNSPYCPGSVPGCYCPAIKPYETCTLDGTRMCVESLSKCICPKGMIYQPCPCTRTCDMKMGSDCKPCKPGCGCPPTNPVWHKGKCIKSNECICPDKCATQGCKECNKCKCKKGKPKCTKVRCPNITSKKGFKSLLYDGCWRLCPSGKRCIFYSPCPDDFNPSCKSFPGGYCKDCNMCKCNKDGTEVCSMNIQSCSDALFKTVKLGCYRLVKGKCTYVNPCPEHPSEKNCCQCSNAGQMSCKECNECECVNELKVCNKDLCPDPTQSGCYVVRSYPGFPKSCFFVSPCPPSQSTGSGVCARMPNADYCNSCALCKCGHQCRTQKCVDPKMDSCYLYNNRLDHCEFVSPCPQCCCEGEITCRDCNECVCRDGKTVCSNNTCGNPIEKGCWVKSSSSNRCEFTIPCPPNAVLDSAQFCATHSGQTFCPSDDCNMCTCPSTYPGPIFCTRIACFQPQGCWRPEDGFCQFFSPCPN